MHRQIHTITINGFSCLKRVKFVSHSEYTSTKAPAKDLRINRNSTYSVCYCIHGILFLTHDVAILTFVDLLQRSNALFTTMVVKLEWKRMVYESCL